MVSIWSLPISMVSSVPIPVKASAHGAPRLRNSPQYSPPQSP